MLIPVGHLMPVWKTRVAQTYECSRQHISVYMPSLRQVLGVLGIARIVFGLPFAIFVYS